MNGSIKLALDLNALNKSICKKITKWPKKIVWCKLFCKNLGIKTEQNTSFIALIDLKYAYIQLIPHPETKYYKLQCVRYIRLQNKILQTNGYDGRISKGYWYNSNGINKQSPFFDELLNRSRRTLEKHINVVKKCLKS